MAKILNKKSLDAAKRAAGLTNEAIAKKLRIHPDTLYKWLSGSREPGLDQVKKLARLLGVGWKELLQ